MNDRETIIAQLKSQPAISVLIIGAGINGIGTFRDLALNGIDVLLIDQKDFCSGASFASSHMAHGGIRYLENGEFRLVQEAVQERNRMIENAPHIVKPLPTTIPIFKFWSGLLNAPLKFLNLLDRPSERGAFVIKFGLMLYDSYTRKQKTVPRHQFSGREVSLQKFPRLNSKVKYTATYFDGLILSPERLANELIADGENEGTHARALNYVSFTGMSNGWVKIKDEITGENLQIKPKVIVNASGPWIDFVNENMNIKSKYIGGTKGSHIIVDNPPLREAIGDHEFFFENKDGRIVLILPFFDKVIIGTSDLPVKDPDDVRCTSEEENYFIELVQRVFPDIKIEPEQIVFRFCGVRPLEYSKAKSTGQITRDHTIKKDLCGPTPVLTLVGGKWTSFRAFSEQTTDELLKILEKTRKYFTRDLPIGGGKNYPKTTQEKGSYINELSSKTGLSKDVVDTLFERYGTKSNNVAGCVCEKGTQPLKTLPHWLKGEIQYLIKQEKVEHLEDLLLRRTNIAWLGYCSTKSITELSDILGECLGWSKAKKASEIERTEKILKESHGVKI